MLTLLGSLLGFISSLLPDVLKLWRDRGDKAHELAILDRQLHMQQVLHTQRLEEIRVQGQVVESTALYKHARFTGVKWVDALGGTVRPIITYAFFMLYMGVKIAQIYLLLNGTYDMRWAEILIGIWHEDDQALFAAVMSFWFGQRALEKWRK